MTVAAVRAGTAPPIALAMNHTLTHVETGVCQKSNFQLFLPSIAERKREKEMQALRDPRLSMLTHAFQGMGKCCCVSRISLLLAGRRESDEQESRWETTSAKERRREERTAGQTSKNARNTFVTLEAHYAVHCSARHDTS